MILTGFLGAGKTTALNRVLGAQHRRRLAVIVNELGRIDIDGQLLRARAGAVVELAGGCVCHEVRTLEELWQALGEVIPRARPDCIVLETTGIAEPGPLLEGLAEHPDHGRTVAASRVVTVVDAEVGLQRPRAPPRGARPGGDRRSHPAVQDRPGRRRPHPRPARAARAPQPGGRDRQLSTRTARGPPPWSPGSSTGSSPASRAAMSEAHRPHRHGQLDVVAFAEDAPLVAEPLLALCGRLGSALVRAKGFVQLAGEPRRAFLERAGDRLTLQLGELWPPGPRRSEIVLIGERLDQASLQRQLWACRAPRGPLV